MLDQYVMSTTLSNNPNESYKYEKDNNDYFYYHLRFHGIVIIHVINKVQLLFYTLMIIQRQPPPLILLPIQIFFPLPLFDHRYTIVDRTNQLT